MYFFNRLSEDLTELSGLSPEIIDERIDFCFPVDFILVAVFGEINDGDSERFDI